jgi:hypothetical protein
MRFANLTRAEGNAVVEFISFSILAIVPISFYAVSSSLEWMRKSELQASASLLARAFAIGGEDTMQEQRDQLPERDFTLETAVANGVITVTLRAGELTAIARSVQ